MNLYVEEKVLQCLRKCGIADRSGVVVAFSGGPDSLCLLDVLHRLVESGKLSLQITACHVDHMLRRSSGSDAGFCHAGANELGVAFELRREDVGAFAAKEGLCIEDAARRVRYRLLEEVAQSLDAPVVVTGHNLDDQAETVVMRMLRGSGLRGLCGIKRVRPISAGSEVLLARPLLDVSRGEILSCLHNRGLNFLTDETNEDTSYFRNRVRAELLPLLQKQYNPAVREVLARVAQSAASVLELLDVQAEKVYCENLLEESAGNVVLSLDGLQGAGDYLLFEVLRRAFEQVLGRSLLSAARFEPIAGAVRGGRTSGRLQPGAGVSVEFAGDRVLVTRLPFPEKAFGWEVPLNVPGVTEIKELAGSITTKVVEGEEFDLEAFKRSRSAREEALDADRAGPNLAARSVREGDRFQPLGLGGTKKISDFLIDEKVPARSKASEAVVTAGGEIAWLLGRRLDGRFRVSVDTRRVLLLTFSDEGST